MKKRSAKALCQRDDRAFAEFEALVRKLAKPPKPEVGTASEEMRQRARDRAGDDPPMRSGRPRT